MQVGSRRREKRAAKGSKLKGLMENSSFKNFRGRDDKDFHPNRDFNDFRD